MAGTSHQGQIMGLFFYLFLIALIVVTGFLKDEVFWKRFRARPTIY